MWTPSSAKVQNLLSGPSGSIITLNRILEFKAFFIQDAHIFIGEFQKVMQPRKRPPGTSVAVSMESRELSVPDGFLPLLSSASVFLPVFFTLDAPLIARKTLSACTRDMHTITRTHTRIYQLFYIWGLILLWDGVLSLAHSLRSLIFPHYRALLSLVFTSLFNPTLSSSVFTYS
jgi:hypothetical protein